MRTSQPQAPNRRTIGLAVLVAIWMIIGLVAHAVIEKLTGNSFVADLLTLVYIIITAFMFFAARRRRQQRSSNA